MAQLGQYISILRKQSDRRSVFVEREGWYYFRVAPNCPPSNLVHVRGGKLCSTYLYGSEYDDYENRAWTVPDLTADLTDLDSVITDVTFTVANYYQLFLLELRMPDTAEQPTTSDWGFYLHGTSDEFATANEAEAWLHSETFQESSPWEHYALGFFSYPICGLVLRNNGTVGNGCNILPVDAINRGRSYIWPRDMRPLTSIYD